MDSLISLSILADLFLTVRECDGNSDVLSGFYKRTVRTAHPQTCNCCCVCITWDFHVFVYWYRKLFENNLESHKTCLWLQTHRDIRNTVSNILDVQNIYFICCATFTFLYFILCLHEGRCSVTGSMANIMAGSKASVCLGNKCVSHTHLFPVFLSVYDWRPLKLYSSVLMMCFMSQSQGQVLAWPMDSHALCVWCGLITGSEAGYGRTPFNITGPFSLI